LIEPILKTGLRRERRAARAGLALACLLWLAGFELPSSHASSCLHPKEFAGWHDWTVAVSCEEEGRGMASLRGPVRLLFGEGLDLNTSDVDALEVLPGIGAARARKIVAARSRRPFETTHELEEVPGIGPVISSKLQRFVRRDATKRVTGE